jgi:hypothetical protein
VFSIPYTVFLIWIWETNRVNVCCARLRVRDFLSFENHKYPWTYRDATAVWDISGRETTIRCPVRRVVNATALALQRSEAPILHITSHMIVNSKTYQEHYSSAYSVSEVSVSELSDNESRKFCLQRINYPLAYSCFICQRSTLPDNEVLKDFVDR